MLSHAGLQREVEASHKRIAEIESCIRDMQRSVPGGSIVDPQVVADTLREIAERHGVGMP